MLFFMEKADSRAKAIYEWIVSGVGAWALIQYKDDILPV